MLMAEVAGEVLTQAFESARKQSDRLFGIIKQQNIYDRPIDARHRVIFYLGHVDAFDSIQICQKGLGVPSPNPKLDQLFEAGIDPDSQHLPGDQPADWPGLDEVQSYVRQSRAHVNRFLSDVPEDLALMALEHRLMHLETLAYMFHNFPYEVKQQLAEAPSKRVAPDSSAKGKWCHIPGGTATLGMKPGKAFGWDNEFGEEKRHVDSFAIQSHSVTNGEYLRFVAEGGELPAFWTTRDGKYFLRGMFSEIPLPLDWPAYVTQKQAQAYANHHGFGLPTEEQFHRAAFGTPEGYERAYPWGDDEPSSKHGNFDFESWEPESVFARPAGASAFGVHQLVGNGWEWTSTPFGPLQGFEPRSTYPGYSVNFFDGEHYVMKGGSPRTAARLLRRTFRNWFRRDYPYMYAKFRCIKS
jgi:gamma-glutamyl hercynylcysteine S-oxide synthase